MTRLLRVLAVSLLSLSAFSVSAQTPGQPYTWPVSVGTSSAQVIGPDTTRRRIAFYNSSDTAKIAVCPTVSRKDSSLITCAVNGPGSITLLPYQSHQLDAVEPSSVNTAWNAIASSAGSPLTVFEWR